MRESQEVECFWCGFEGKIELKEKSNAGVFYENENRIHVLGICPGCDRTLISFFYTKEK